jgi:hypothetical protein
LIASITRKYTTAFPLRDADHAVDDRDQKEQARSVGFSLQSAEPEHDAPLVFRKDANRIDQDEQDKGHADGGSDHDW